MSVKRNAVGPDVLNPGPRTPERDAELDAGLEDDAFAYDLSTRESAMIAVRPAATLFFIQGLVTLIPLAIVIGQVMSDPDLVFDWPIFTMLILIGVGLFVLSALMFRGSFSAMIIAALYAAYLWANKLIALWTADIASLWGGIVWLVILTATLGFGVPAAYKLMIGEFEKDEETASDPSPAPNSNP